MFKWIDLGSMSEEEKAAFVSSRIETPLSVEFNIGPPIQVSVLKGEQPSLGYFLPDPGGSVLVLPVEMKGSPYVVKPSEDTRMLGQRRYVARFHTGCEAWRGSKYRTRFPVTISWDDELSALVARLWDDPNAEQFVLYFDLSYKNQNRWADIFHQKEGSHVRKETST